MFRCLATRYSARVHSLLLGWNALAAAYVGSAGFRDAADGLARTLRVPLWAVALFTGLINITVSYRNWQRLGANGADKAVAPQTKEEIHGKFQEHSG